jgi:UDP-N-acetyl-D-galactosamine dehydrogenase
VPVLEKKSNLVFNKDFFCGYSPERINPGDKTHKLPDIVKVTSGSTPEVAEFVNSLYSKIITAGTFKAASIEVAEAAKVIENTQRDINIALINELSMLFNKMNIDTQDVLDAAGTKWNFLDFRPGLVGGHCIGVDPYYLTHKAKQINFNAEMVLSGRRINDGMARYITDRFTRSILDLGKDLKKSRLLIMGFTFKENCPDIRNTKVLDIYKNLSLQSNVDIYDTQADAKETKELYGVELINELKPGIYDGLILAVPHKEIIELGIDFIKGLGTDNLIFYDLKSIFGKEVSDLRS